jgi:LacI family transcriptional regulator
MVVTLKDLAAYCGVHTSTVSRVLRGKENLKISEKTRKKIFSAAKKFNYQPNQTARTLRLKKSNTIGLIVPDISNPFFSRIAKRIDNLAYDAGYMLIVVSTDENQQKEHHFVNEFLSRGVEGLMLIPAQDEYKHIQGLLNDNFPLVLIDRNFENFKANVVISNNEEASYEAVKYLSELGHKRIAVLSGRQNLYSIKKRIQGYKKAVKDFNLEQNSELIAGDGHRIEDGFKATMNLLNLEIPPTALIISGNLISVGALTAIGEKGLKVPQDISIIGFTDSLYSEFLSTPMSTISHPLQEIGEKAINLLFKHMKSAKKLPYEKIIVKTVLTIRESVGSVNSRKLQ